MYRRASMQKHEKLTEIVNQVYSSTEEDKTSEWPNKKPKSATILEELECGVSNCCPSL